MVLTRDHSISFMGCSRNFLAQGIEKFEILLRTEILILLRCSQPGLETNHVHPIHWLYRGLCACCQVVVFLSDYDGMKMQNDITVCYY